MKGIIILFIGIVVSGTWLIILMFDIDTSEWFEWPETYCKEVVCKYEGQVVNCCREY